MWSLRQSGGIFPSSLGLKLSGCLLKMQIPGFYLSLTKLGALGVRPKTSALEALWVILLNF